MQKRLPDLTCIRCGCDDVPIQLTCSDCGDVHSDSVDDMEFKVDGTCYIREYGPDLSDDFKLKLLVCSCGNKYFDWDQNSFCNYCQHMSDKDD